MAHQIEQMAYVGATPWHGLGNNLPQKQPIEVWQREAGMDWQILESPVHFKSDAVGHLGAIHSFPEQKVLYVNEGFTHEIVGLPEDEGKDLLEYLVRRFYEPEHQVRFKWQPGSLAIWDNRAVQHKGIADYGYARRELVRVVAGGDRPIAA